MIAKSFETRLRWRLAAAATFAVFLAGCATQEPAGSPQGTAANKSLQEARSVNMSEEERAAHYLDAAALAAPGIGDSANPGLSLQTYNSAAAELTVLLRTGESGRLWNHPLTLRGQQKTFHLQLQSGSETLWSPGYFTDFKLPRDIKLSGTKQPVVQAGVGGALVGVRLVTPREPFNTVHGVAAPVTATLDFRGNDAILALHRSATHSTAQVQGAVRPLAADYSAPIAYFRPTESPLLQGVRAAFRGGRYMEKTGLYFLEPYDPDRIPVVLIHGLISTPFTWIRAVHELEADPDVRRHYQFWFFAYPSGNPPLYSALRLRDELARVDKLYPEHRGYVLVGHSMGGILSRAQVESVGPADWKREIGEQPAKEVFSRSSSGSLFYRSIVFQSNPRVKRVVFVCTPHRGSNMATGGLGKFARSLIRLPLTLTAAFTEAIGNVDLSQFTGSSKRLPNSISGLSPKNPSLRILDQAPLRVPYHSIIGDRGKGDSPNSTDGVVPYSSSHLNGAQSECIVPGPHSACELPETITELNRILKLHLKSS